MNARFKEIRTKSGLSQEEFGRAIGIESRGHISSLESGTKKITDRIIKDVCREFNVNEEWLRDGTLPMEKTPDDEYDKISYLIGERDERAKRAIIDYWNLTEPDKELFWRFVDRFILKKEGD